MSVFDRKIFIFFVLRAVVCDRNCFDFGGLRGMNERFGVEYGISWGGGRGETGVCKRDWERQKGEGARVSANECVSELAT